MKIAEIALVPPLLVKAFVRTFRAGRKAMRAQAIKDPKERQKEFGAVVRKWAHSILQEMHVSVEVHGAELESGPCIFVGNHMSYLDILVLNSVVAANFVAKSEIRKWPIVGRAASIGGTIFVKRNSKNSKLEVAETIRHAVLEERKQIIVFPEGTTSLFGRPWRRGIFRIAFENKIPVQAFSIVYEPARRSAYIDRDHFFTHFIKILARRGTRARIEFQPVVLLSDLEEDSKKMESWSLSILRRELQNQKVDVPPELITSST
jgi:1-acyl-sn-glycerol-3-phosphate acyltransferase